MFSDGADVQVQPYDIFMMGAIVDANQIVYYYISVREGRAGSSETDVVWTIRKRFSQFVELYNALQSKGYRRVPKIPSKESRIVTDHTSQDFIKRRCVFLDKFLQKLSQNHTLVSSLEFQLFTQQNKVDLIPKHLITRSGSLTSFPDDIRRTLSDMSESFSEIASISIPSTKQMSDHTLFQIFCTKETEGMEHPNEWVSLKRYRDFHEMDRKVKIQLSVECPRAAKLIPKLPHRSMKILLNHFHPDFIEERRLMLEHYLQEMVAIPQVMSNDVFLRFINARFG